MSPFFRGNVRPPRKQPRPWSLNPRLNPDIAKDGPIDARASIYGVGNNKEAITLPVHNGVYYSGVSYDKRDEEPVVAVAAEKEKVVSNAAAPLLRSTSAAPTEFTTGKESYSNKQVSSNDWPRLRAGSPGIARAAETSGLETAVTREEKETERKGVPNTADMIDNRPGDASIEAPKVKTSEKQSRKIVEGEALRTAIVPAPSSIEKPETGERTEETVPVTEESIVPPSQLTEILPSSPTKSRAAPLQSEAGDTMAPPHAAESTVAEPLSPAEVSPFETAESKEASKNSSHVVEAEPAVGEQPASASVDAAPQSQAEEKGGAPVMPSEKPAQINGTGTSLPVERVLTPPPERYQLVDSGPLVGEAGTLEDQQDETDDESAAEAPFIPDHRHTPPASRKSSRGEEDEKPTAPTPVVAAAAFEDNVNKAVPQTATEAVKGVDDTLSAPIEQEDTSVANEEPLMWDEQLDVSDEFRPGVKINPDADD